MRRRRRRRSSIATTTTLVTISIIFSCDCVFTTNRRPSRQRCSSFSRPISWAFLPMLAQSGKNQQRRAGDNNYPIIGIWLSVGASGVRLPLIVKPLHIVAPKRENFYGLQGCRPESKHTFPFTDLESKPILDKKEVTTVTIKKVSPESYRDCILPKEGGIPFGLAPLRLRTREKAHHH